MISGYSIRENQYYDSVFLMGINKKLSDHPGVIQTAILMGTESNKELLLEIGISDDGIDAAQANDLIVGVIAESQETVDRVIANLDSLLIAENEGSTQQKIHHFEDGLKIQPDSNLAVISIPGEYVYREALKVLDAGLHVFIFSSNVPVEEEKELKTIASEKGLLVMGPDCGTSLIGGAGIGFANAVRRGPIGVIGASGTGIQEFTCQVHNAGQGISHAIGTGSNDVKDEIGGITSFQAVDVLESDAETEVIVFISKPPGVEFQHALSERLDNSSKPAVCCFLGADSPPAQSENVTFTSTIDEAVAQGLMIVSGRSAAGEPDLSIEESSWIDAEVKKYSNDQQYLRGVFAGGTFTFQAQKVLQELGIEVFSNAPLKPDYQMDDPDRSLKNSIVDMGDEFYTRGKPHPMIDGTLRIERILTEGQDPEVAILFLDFILGYNSAPDPVGELLDAIQQAQRSHQQKGGQLTIVASICGTEDDQQDLNLQAQMLQEQGAYVFFSNSRAALFCGELLKQMER